MVETGSPTLESLEVKMKNNFYKNKVVLVTGGTGFVGSHLVEELILLGAKVITTYLDIDLQGYFWTKSLNEKVVMVRVDVKNYREVFGLITKYKVEIIFHLAAQAIVETAYVNPLETLETNIMGTVNILESARQNLGVKAVVVASSDKAYGKMKDKEYLESHPLRGDHPYDVSKSAADLISQAYFKTYDLRVVTTRFGNIYGEGDTNFSRILPVIFRSIFHKETVKLRSDGKSQRDYLYVKDVVLGYLLLAQNIDITAGEAFNFGSKDNFNVLELISVIEKSLKVKIDYEILGDAKNEIPNQSLNFDKITEIGWKNTVKLSNITPKIFKWYKQYFK